MMYTTGTCTNPVVDQYAADRARVISYHVTASRQNGWNRTKGALRRPFFCAALARDPRRAADAQGAGRSRHDSDRPASGGADIYKYILASGGADISAGRPASGGADRRPWSRIPRCIFDYIDLQNACRCATDAIE
jgi:hypothetical protein